MNKFSIKDIEAITCIKSHTLRIWEQRYNFLQTKRTETNIRYYDEEDLKLLLNISTLNDNGYKISAIAEMTPAQIAAEVANLSKDQCNYSCHIQSLCKNTLELNEKELKKLLCQSIKKIGMEQTMLEIIYPFLKKIGIMWQTGTINPAQEHFASNIIKQRLITHIDGLKPADRSDAKKFLLFLPEGEMHEIGLLFAYYMIRSKGHEVLYLGQNLSLKYVEDLFRYYHPDYVFSMVTYPVLEANTGMMVQRFKEIFKDVPVLLAGNQLNSMYIESCGQVHLLNEVTQLEHLLKELDLQEA